MIVSAALKTSAMSSCADTPGGKCGAIFSSTSLFICRLASLNECFRSCTVSLGVWLMTRACASRCRTCASQLDAAPEATPSSWGAPTSHGSHACVSSVLDSRGLWTNCTCFTSAVAVVNTLSSSQYGHLCSLSNGRSTDAVELLVPPPAPCSSESSQPAGRDVICRANCLFCALSII